MRVSLIAVAWTLIGLAPAVAGTTPEEAEANFMRPYNNGLTALDIFSQEQGCAGEGAMRVNETVAELKKQADLLHRVSTGSSIPTLLDKANRSKDHHTEIAFSFADKAKNKRCLDIADQQYRDLIDMYVGSAYSGIRDRAKIGIDDVREARRNQVSEPAPLVADSKKKK